MPTRSGSPAPVPGDGRGSGGRLPPEAASRIALALAGVVAALVLYSSWATVRSPFDAAIALVIVAGVVHGILGWAPRLRVPAQLGLVSLGAYGLVLLLFLLVTPARMVGDEAAALWTRLGCGVAVAVVVHLVFAQPSRVRRSLGWQGVAALALLPGLVGAAALGASGLSGPAPARPQEDLLLATGPDEDESVSEALTFPTEGPTAVSPAPGPPPTVDPGQAAAGTTVATSAAPAARAAERTTTTRKAAAPTAAPTTTAKPRAVKILVSGESTAGATGGGMRKWGQRNGRAQVEVVGSNGCALQQEGTAYWRPGWAFEGNPACLQLIDYTIEVAKRFQPDVIVLFIGTCQLMDWVLPGQTTATHIGEPDFDRRYSEAAAAALRKLGTLGIPTLFTTTPVPNHPGGVGPGTGPFVMNDAGRTRRLNELTTAVVRGQPLTAMVPYAERISNPDGTVPTSIRPDGVHLSQDAVPGLMDRVLESDFRTAYQQVTRRVPSSARPGPQVWS